MPQNMTPAYHKAWRRKHRVHLNAKEVRQRHALRNAAYALLGGKCARCGFTDGRALQFDHIHGGGKKKDGDHRTHRRFIRQILNGSRPDIQLLCANCNWIKRAEQKEHN